MQLFKILAVFCLVAFVGIVVADTKAFLRFVEEYDKQYATEEEFTARYTIFKENLERVKHMNSFERDPETFGVTKFSDMTPSEFKKFLNYRPSAGRGPRPEVPTFHETPEHLLPAMNEDDTVFFDWAMKNATTPVYNQLDCGSCWAFSATEEVESMWFLAGNNLTMLSMQQIVDCDTGDEGCDGGDTETAYDYIKKAGGLEPYSTIPYTGKGGECTFNAADIVASIDGYTVVSHDFGGENETAMLLALQQVGPLSICVDAETWQFYSPGHIISFFCGHILDHCVQLTGYGTAASGVDYWNVRNSWGTDWGNDGYLMVERNHNLCGIADEVTYVNIPSK